MLDIPMEYIAWSLFKRTPFLMANDLPMEIPSSIQSRAIAIAVLVSSLIDAKLTCGIEKDRNDLSIDGRKSIPNRWPLIKYESADMAIKTMAIFGSFRNLKFNKA